MNKIKKFLVLLILVIVSVFCVAGCNSGTDDGLPEEEKPVLPQNCEVIVETTLYGAADRCSDFIAVCNSFDEFKEECLSNGYDFFDNSNPYDNYYNTVAGEKIREYTDEYFENKAFVVCAFFKSSWVGQYRIEKVEVEAEGLTLYIKRPYSNTADAVINNAFLIAGVDKSLVSDITDLEYILR